ncbi:glycosyltransferase [Horticoccus luteus]|uniref:Glycosyltransferase n=1 Tax=Horticoccus luteus TaxID=2862869 RepID=A0A8F9TYS5_9BACT|nr:glycosyltransferase [Horticoccus luteus]QYM80487.1 glycosyltransferase [Horticoccus luteus]
MSSDPRLFLYYKTAPEANRWLPGDRWIRPLVRRVVRGPRVPSGIDKVYLNLAAGLRKIGVPFQFNRPWHEIRPGDRVGVIGRDRPALAGYDRPNPIVAGVALMTHPSEWPTLCQDYPVARYVQHCQWAIDIYRPYYGDKVCAVWPVGIDTDAWQPASASARTCDFLLYNKIRWNHAAMDRDLVEPIRADLRRAGLTFEEILYGHYRPEDYAAALRRCRAMIFICEHESQGIAYQEALAAGVPVLAWDPGEWLDPARFAWGTPHVAATSVPYFDARCGERFVNHAAFGPALGVFQDRLQAGRYAPRDYIMENLTLERSARRYLKLLNEVASQP